MTELSMKGVVDMHVHTNPDLRLRAYDDFELCDAAVRVGARAIVIKTHLGDTSCRAAISVKDTYPSLPLSVKSSIIPSAYLPFVDTIIF